MKTIFIILCLLSAVLLAGYVVAPVPSDGRTYGKVITPEQVSFIVPGKTTKGEVEEKMGVNYRDYRESKKVKALAYSWETPATGWAWGAFMVVPPSGVAGGNYHENSHWCAFIVEFESGDRVRRAEFVHLSHRKSLDEQLENWALKNPSHRLAELIETGGGVFNPATGSPWVIEEMKP